MPAHYMPQERRAQKSPHRFHAAASWPNEEIGQIFCKKDAGNSFDGDALRQQAIGTSLLPANSEVEGDDHSCRLALETKKNRQAATHAHRGVGSMRRRLSCGFPPSPTPQTASAVRQSRFASNGSRQAVTTRWR
jgi:hypothetical protein